MKNLDLAIASDPENGLFYYVKGFIQSSEMDDNEGALISFDKALELDPTNADALYMKGFIFVDRANDITEEMNKLPLNAKTKYKQKKAEQKAEFEMALPLFEKAFRAETIRCGRDAGAKRSLLQTGHARKEHGDEQVAAVHAS